MLLQRELEALVEVGAARAQHGRQCGVNHAFHFSQRK